MNLIIALYICFSVILFSVLIWSWTSFQSAVIPPLIVHSGALSNTAKAQTTQKNLNHTENSLPYSISEIPSESESLLLLVYVCQEVLFKTKPKTERKICKASLNHILLLSKLVK